MMPNPAEYITLIFLLICVLFLIKLILTSPSNLNKWKQQYQILPSFNLVSNNIHIKNLRDFRFDKEGNILQQRYLDKNYRLEDLKSTWYGISHFASYGLAHVFLSFEFAHQQYLVISIEARLTEHNIHFNPLKGLFRTYTKTVVLATEQDAIGLRTHTRGEKVYLYKLQLSPAQQTKLLLNNLNVAQQLTTKAEFYNTFLDNCLTGLLAQTRRYKNWTNWLDYRIILPGFSDRSGYEAGFIDNSETLDQVRAKALINPSSMTLDDPQFSIKIRQ